jgi:hypothetical protein
VFSEIALQGKTCKLIQRCINFFTSEKETDSVMKFEAYIESFIQIGFKCILSRELNRPIIKANLKLQAFKIIIFHELNKIAP